ncbi:MAG: trypsin-like serine protease [Chloroflexi bacterium]|nr:trypsin-like serine protease [Chloroflexota bacterium]
MQAKARIASVVVILLLVVQVFGSSVQAQKASTGAGNEQAAINDLVVSKVISPAEQKAAMAYWTRQRLADAAEMAIPVDTAPALIDESALSESSAADMEPGFSPAGYPSPSADVEAQSAYAYDWAAPNFGTPADMAAMAMDEPAGTTQVYTSYTVNQANTTVQTMYPHKWVGRLTFLDLGSTYYCSATAISGNAIVTAAHCVYDSTNNRWFSNWVFTPAYRNGSAPYGTFVATKCVVLTSWINLSGSFSINGWTKYDVAVCKMGNNSSGQTLNTAVGYAGRQWNYGYVRHFHVMGYPLKNYANTYIAGAGLYLRACASESFQQTTDTRGTGCNWGGGISGGPWMPNYSLGVGGSVDGVNSGIYVGTQNMYGARFTSSNIVPLCTSAPC